MCFYWMLVYDILLPSHIGQVKNIYSVHILCSGNIVWWSLNALLGYTFQCLIVFVIKLYWYKSELLEYLYCIPVFFSKHSVSGDRYGYNNHPKRTVSPNLVTCYHVRRQCSFGLVTVTASVPGYRGFQKNAG